ncbi:MAG TPA: S9 family peptidase [Gemmatimonadales bacterium]|nr:S9 family peptidase [Gemmatimonadales bacterium]
MRVNGMVGWGLAMTIAAVPAAGAQQDSAPTAPPRAAQRPHRLEAHGDVRVDEYYWLNQRDDPEVIRYLEAENAWTEAVMAHTRPLQDSLFDEIKGRIRQDDRSVPYRLDGYWYYTRFEQGREYPLYARKRGSLDAPEELLLDVNLLAQGHAFFAAASVQVGPGTSILSHAADTLGRRIYTIRFRDLTTGRDLPDEIPSATANVAWAMDGRTVFYTRQDPVTLRWHRVYRHTLGTDPAQDPLVYEETDETFSVSVSRTKSRRFIVIGAHQTLSDEYRFVAAARPDEPFTMLQPRERGLEHDVDHFGDFWYIRTNLEARNFRLVRAPLARPDRAHWEEVVPHRPDVLLQGFELFRDHLVLAERERGLTRLRVRPWRGGTPHDVQFAEPAYVVFPTQNLEFDTPILRFAYQSLTTPASTYDYDMATRQRTLLKREEVLGGFDPAAYEARRLYARATDGTEVPVSLVFRKDLRRQGPQPLLLYGYGSYGSSTEPGFSAPRLSLLDRGFVYAIAHVRGGQELGRWWYEDGKLLKKRNTFTDFIAVAEHLVAEGWTTPGMLYAQGGSAGGLLMGAVLNLRPDLFHGVVAQVPFVDVVTTMLDASIPLTTAEYDEWGNPGDSTYYRYMLSYSPYDNVARVAYPHVLVTTGLHDSEVQYFEPAKWVARLRARRTDANRLLLKTNLQAGHGGASGRAERWRETAFVYAFLVDLARPATPPTP